MKFKAILFVSIIMLSFACKHSKKTEKATAPDIYRVIVTFISKGAGTDKTLIASFESYLASFGKKYEKTLIFDKYIAGREGELDYCFYLKELSGAKQKEFVAGLKNLAKDSQMVFIQENTVCAHKK